jgi:raffinose/stachyose/melibiose transport system permease protein
MSANARARVSRSFSNLFLAGAVIIAVIPFLLVGINALKPHAEIVANPLALPASLDFSNFTTAWVSGKFSTGLVNSILLSGTTILVTVSFAALAAFPLARRRIRFWQLITLYFLCSVTVPIQLFLFPLYFLYAQLGVVGNIFATAFILSAINLPLSIFLLRTYILTIPVELDDAALMDGAGPWLTFWHVILPLMRPGLITVAIIVGLNAWNEFLITSTFQQGESGFTMMLGYRSMTGTILNDRGIMMAGAVIIIVPIIIFFLAMQRFFIAGMTSGAVKG